MKLEEINNLLKDLYEKEGTTGNEKKALLEACGCVWSSRMNKVIDVSSFMNMLYNHMGYKYDVDVETTDTETIFHVKTFMDNTGRNN